MNLIARLTESSQAETGHLGDRSYKDNLPIDQAIYSPTNSGYGNPIGDLHSHSHIYCRRRATSVLPSSEFAHEHVDCAGSCYIKPMPSLAAIAARFCHFSILAMHHHRLIAGVPDLA